MRDIGDEFPPHGLQVLDLRDVAPDQQHVTARGTGRDRNGADNPARPGDIDCPLLPLAGGEADAHEFRDLMVSGHLNHGPPSHSRETAWEERERRVIDGENFLVAADDDDRVIEGAEDGAQAAIFRVEHRAVLLRLLHDDASTVHEIGARGYAQQMPNRAVHHRQPPPKPERTPRGKNRDDATDASGEPDEAVHQSYPSKRYPYPRTVTSRVGVAGSASIFSRSCRMWTSTVRGSP